MTSIALAQQTPSAHQRRDDRAIRVSPTSLWILHREDAVRRGLAKRLDVRGALLGDPRDAGRRDTAVPHAIVLGVSGDFEAELEFAYRMAEGAPELAWLVVAHGEDLGEAERLFDTLPGRVDDLDGDAARLRGHIRGLLSRRQSPPLSERRRRRALTERFTRWHADLASPSLLAATDPKRVRVPVWVRGEAGTGRGVLTRYLHQLATGVPAGPFVTLACTGVRDVAALRNAWTVESGELPSGLLTTLCLEGVDSLSATLQEELARWIEYGTPAGFGVGGRLRWMATTDGPLEPALQDALAGLEIELPALRDDPERIEDCAREITRDWCRAHELPERELSAEAIERLRAHSWPGNLRELESVLARSLAASSEATLPAEALCWRGGDAEEAEPEAFRGEERAAGDPDAAMPTGAAAYAEDGGATPWPSANDAPDALENDEDPLFLAGEVAPDPTEEIVLTTEVLEDASVSPLEAPEMADAFSPPQPTETAGTTREGIRRLAGAVAHEIGNPLVGIRSFAQMLPRRFEDPEFRRVATERVAADATRIENALDTLARLAQPHPETRENVDLSAMIAGLLAERRGAIQERGLVVLEELDREHARVLSDRDQLRAALVSLFDAVFELLRDNGDLYVATQGQSEEGGLEPFTRALVRFSTGDAEAPEGLSRVEQSLGIATATLLIEGLGGQLVLDQSEAPTALLLFELPTAPDPLPSL